MSAKQESEVLLSSVYYTVYIHEDVKQFQIAEDKTLSLSESTTKTNSNRPGTN